MSDVRSGARVEGEHDYRARVQRAVCVCVAMGLFVAFGSWVIKHVDSLYLHEPWVDDPYDAVVSFAMTAIVLMVGAVAARASLNQPGRPGVRRRCGDLLRGCRVVVWLAAGTELSDWVSVALGTERRIWNAATLVACGVLAAFTAGTVVAALVLRRAGRSPDGAAVAADVAGPDWLADAVTFLDRAAASVGARRGGAVTRALGHVDAVWFGAVRRRPLWAALSFAVVIAVVGGAPQLVLEGYSVQLALVFVISTACSMYAFTAVFGSYLRVVGSGAAGGPSIAAVTGLAVAVVVPVVAAFRVNLWPAIGVDADTGGATALSVLCVVAALVTAVVVAPVTWAVRRARV